jgi:hypothetical protein
VVTGSWYKINKKKKKSSSMKIFIMMGELALKNGLQKVDLTEK